MAFSLLPLPHDAKPSRQARKSFQELIEAGQLEEAVEALRAGMKATRKFYSPITKSWEEEPDHRTRLDAAKTILAYAVGMPLQRSVAVTEDFVSLREALVAASGRSERARAALAETFGTISVESSP